MGYTKMGSVLAILGVMFLSWVCMANGADVHHYSFILKETNFTKLCESKSALTVNGSIPGPTITVRKGDTAFVNVHNNGEYGVTIHWHGVKQPRNPWSDGPENITQCPIAAGTNMTYEVIFSREEGTLWWHAHSDWTRATVHGAIIILPANGTTYPFATPDAQETLILGSWFKGDVMEIIKEALASGADPNITNAFTINGQPGDLYDCSNATTYRWVVDYGKTYLLRLINAVMNEEQFFSIANHTLTVVAQDAAYLKPINTSLIMITPGQTMDILVTANKTPSHYYIASTSFVDGNVNYQNTTTTAILQYNGNYSAPSTPSSPTLPDHNDTTAADNFTSQIRALASEEHPVSVPLNISSKIFIAVAINERICPNASCSGPNNNALSASLNNISFVIPNSSVLQAYYGGDNGNGNVYTPNFPDNPPRPYNYTGDNDNTTYPSFGTKARMINYGEGVEIVFQGTNIIAPENHPMHLHGFSFYLVGTGSGNYDNTTSPTTYNLVDPPEVNTIGIPKNGWAAIRFLADNPGVWFMHCHLERHTSWGMDNVFIVRNGNTTATSIRAPPAYMPPCS